MEDIDLDGEIWRPVPGTDGFYEASSCGRIGSYVVGGRPKRDGTAKPRLPCRRILQPYQTKRGTRRDGTPIVRYKVDICLPGSPKHRMYVAELVCSAFRGPRPPDAVVRHWNDNSEDDRIENLYWGTPEENRLDAEFNRRPDVMRMDPTMGVIHRCMRTGEPVLHHSPWDPEGCDCPQQEIDPERCTECLVKALGLEFPRGAWIGCAS
jgi:hypothetical protein